MATRNLRAIVLRIIGIGFFAGIIVFMYFKFQAFIYGPRIVDISLEPFMTIDTSSLEIQGKVKYTEEMFINGRSILLDETGEFKETIVFPAGHSVIEIHLVDPFGKEKFHYYNIYTNHSIASENEPELLLTIDNEETL